MEGHNGGLRGFWKRKQYQRLGGAEDVGGGGAKKWRRRRRKRNVHHRVELAAAPVAGQGNRTTGTKRRRFWRIKVAPGLGFLRLVVSPRRCLVRMRDAYVRMMLSLASSPAFGVGDVAATGFARPAVKEYDEKVMVEVYKSLAVRRHVMAPTAAPGDGGGQGRR